MYSNLIILSVNSIELLTRVTIMCTVMPFHISVLVPCQNVAAVIHCYIVSWDLHFMLLIQRGSKFSRSKRGNSGDGTHPAKKVHLD